MTSEEKKQPKKYIRSKKYVRPKVHSVTIFSDVDKILIDLAQKRGEPKRTIASMMITRGNEINILDEGYNERADAVREAGKIQIQKNYYAGLERPCPGMFYADDAWKCLWAREGKPPQIKKLAKDLHDALNACKSCDKTGKILKHNAELKNQITVLESRLEEKSNKTFKAPVCNYGATLSRDGLTFSGCRLSPGKLVSVMEYCKKRMSGRPCNSYSESIIGVGKFSN